MGLTEKEFWDMTFGEIERYADSRMRVRKVEAKDKATMDYLQALVIGKYVVSAFDGKVKVPEIHEVYPSLFDAPSIEGDSERQDMLSALRFKQFADSFNQKFNKEEQVVDE